MNLEIKCVNVCELFNWCDKLKSKFNQEKKQDYQIVLDVESNLKLYLDELYLFYKKYLMNKLKKIII